LKTKAQLQFENAALLAQVQSLKGDRVRLVLLAQENEELKGVLGRKGEKETMTIAAVLAKPPQSLYDTLIIDGGTDHGFAVGDMVVAGGYIALGTIVEVSASVAKVKLYSMPGERLTVTLGAKNISIDAFGQGAGNFTAEVPRDALVVEGDLVTFPSINTKVVGQVSKTILRASDSFQSVYFRLPVNVSELRWVEVVRSAKSGK
jgi:cell shape-determining protein MreC